MRKEPKTFLNRPNNALVTFPAGHRVAYHPALKKKFPLKSLLNKIYPAEKQPHSNRIAEHNAEKALCCVFE